MPNAGIKRWWKISVALAFWQTLGCKYDCAKAKFFVLNFSWKLKSAFIYHSFHLITGTTPSKLSVNLKGRANLAQSSRAGIYFLGAGLVNGKSYWLQDPGSNSIWYNNKAGRWNIAEQKHLGSNQAGIYSIDGVAGPQVVTTWRYLNKKKWITSYSDDISVDDFVRSGKYK